MPIPGTIVAPVQSVILPAGYPGTGAPSQPQGSGWEVQVWDHTFSHIIAYIPSWMTLSFTQIGSDKGSGTIQLPIDSAVFGPNPLSGTLMTDEVLFRVLQNGVPRFDFLAETVTETEADSSEQRTVTITGNGSAQTLTWGVSMPFGWPSVKVSKADAIIDQFSTLDPTGTFYELDPNVWNAVTPGAVTIPAGGTCDIALSPSGAYLGGGPYDMTGSSFSVSLAEATPILGTNATDGSEVIQFIVSSATGVSGGYAMIALTYQDFYCQFTDAEGNAQQKIIAAGEVGATAPAIAYDSSWAQYWRISCDVTSAGVQTWRFWASGDGITWTVYWSVTPAHPFVATTCNIYMGGIYDSSGFARTQVSSINGEITNPPSAGSVFLSQPIMASWLQLLLACQQRGTMPWIAPAFNARTDSGQNIWTDTWSIQVPNGTDLFTLLQEYMGAIGGDFIMQPGFVLQAGRQGSLGIDRSQSVIFPDGQVTQKGRTQDRTTIANLVAAQDADGQMLTVTSTGSIALWNQREMLAASGGVIDSVSAESLATATLDQAQNQVDQRILQIPPNQLGRTVWQDFAVFDWVGVERADFSAVDANRVMGITVSVDQDGAEIHELVLQTYRQYIIAQLQYLINKFSGQSISTLGALPPAAVTGPLPSPLASTSAALSAQSSSSAPSSSSVSQAPGTILGTTIVPASIPATAVNFSAVDIGGTVTYIQGTAPIGAVDGSLWFDSSNGFRLNQQVGGVWTPYQWGTGSIAAGTITAAQIAANTITAAQIQANTITVAQLAAGIIYAGIINGTTITGNTITGGTISGSSFMGPDFIINSSGAFFYSGTPASGNLTVSIAASSGSDGFGNHYLAGVTAYTGSDYANLNNGVGTFTAAAALNVAGPISASGTSTFTGDVSVSGSSSVSGPQDVSGPLTVSGSCYFTGSGITVGNGSQASITLNPRIATPSGSPPYANDPFSGGTFGSGERANYINIPINGLNTLISGFQNRGMLN